MNQQQYVRGKWLVLGIGALLLGISVWVSVYYVMVRGTDRLLVQALRFSLEVALLWQLYRGHAWARWLTVVLFGIGGMLGLVGIGARLHWLTVSMTVTYLTSAILLAISPSIVAFLTEQERRRQCGK